ncbi:3-isopropylmalate dehydrogenase [Blattabacterium sp. (Blattella germanica) str. Bge]|uniref:3-isopropylmalate dehydrogenase n=1 Tax=Blattabacterium sp. (Blattella germanica) TaxID=624186 RepID=UPI0001BB62E7|nr:3-isopropylmalate dehydrogenase [Blattabacterium sp. (Blattella germanica)]ACY40103.1 3-isopropylmalate dehydrogenase [Blattabacterium sp. (Blattella germanica) str. Bge]
MKKNISVIEGDGIGPEVMKETIKILNSIAKKYGHNFNYQKTMAGSLAIEKFGNPMPEETIDSCLKSDAVLFGCIGDAKYDKNPRGMRPEDGLLKLRKRMNLYCNIRPIVVHSKVNKSPIKEELLDGVDFIIYRELTGGIYFGEKGRSQNGEVAYDHCIYSKEEIERIGEMAFKAALSRRKKVTLVDKANVLETSRLWREVIQKIALDYPGVRLDFLYIDNAAMQIIMNPKKFDIILTDNLFGDILSDESSVIASSLGLLPSASIGNNKSMFEPIHGSYPQAKGKNIANPLGCILSGSMMLEYFGMHKEKNLLEEAVKKSIEARICTQDLIDTEFSSTTEEVGDYIEKYIRNQ